MISPTINWYPIETAPKDGYEFLGCHLSTDGYTGDWQVIAWYSGDDNYPWEDMEGRHPFEFLTHWAPLPKYPEPND